MSVQLRVSFTPSFLGNSSVPSTAPGPGNTQQKTQQRFPSELTLIVGRDADKRVHAQYGWGNCHGETQQACWGGGWHSTSMKVWTRRHLAKVTLAAAWRRGGGEVTQHLWQICIPPQKHVHWSHGWAHPPHPHPRGSAFIPMSTWS